MNIFNPINLAGIVLSTSTLWANRDMHTARVTYQGTASSVYACIIYHIYNFACVFLVVVAVLCKQAVTIFPPPSPPPLLASIPLLSPSYLPAPSSFYLSLPPRPPLPPQHVSNCTAKKGKGGQYQYTHLQLEKDGVILETQGIPEHRLAGLFGLGHCNPYLSSHSMECTLSRQEEGSLVKWIM